jgi:5-methylcytosine-specific restriction enzyme A
MPISAPKPCAHPGCGKLVSDGRYCQAHKRERNANRFADTHRGSRHERGYGTAWDRLRVCILQRDNGLCQPCIKQGRVTMATQVDHIVQKKDGGTDEESNLQAICTECHKFKTAREASHGRGVSKV